MHIQCQSVVYLLPKYGYEAAKLRATIISIWTQQYLISHSYRADLPWLTLSSLSSTAEEKTIDAISHVFYMHIHVLGCAPFRPSIRQRSVTSGSTSGLAHSDYDSQIPRNQCLLLVAYQRPGNPEPANAEEGVVRLELVFSVDSSLTITARGEEQTWEAT